MLGTLKGYGVTHAAVRKTRRSAAKRPVYLGYFFIWLVHFQGFFLGGLYFNLRYPLLCQTNETDSFIIAPRKTLCGIFFV